jgi:hypothetical protein
MAAGTRAAALVNPVRSGSVPGHCARGVDGGIRLVTQMVCLGRPRTLFVFQTLEQLVDLPAQCPNPRQQLQQLGFVSAHDRCCAK